jgi:hypothetical protein
MGHQGFSLAWPVVKEELLGGLTVLVLDYVPGGYPQGVFDVVVALGVRFIGDVNGGDDANSLHNG